MAVARRAVLPVLAVVALAGLGWAGWRWWTDWRFVEGTDNAYVEADTTPIAPKVPGYVATVAVQDNQHVVAGDVLLELDAAEYRADVDAARAVVDSQKAKLTTLDAQIDLQATLIERAQAGVDAAEADLRWAESDYGRSEKLVKNNWASKETYEHAGSQIDRARAMAAQARADKTAAEGQLAVYHAQRDEVVAALRQAQASQARAEADLDGTVIRAPVAGIIGAKSAQPGQYLRAGAQAMVLVPLPAVHVVANFKETQIGQMLVGQPVRVVVDAWPDQPIEGRIASLAPASGAEFSLLPPENATGNFTKIVQRVPVRVEVDPHNPLAGRLRPGLSVEVSVDVRGEGTGESVAGVFGAALAATGTAQAGHADVLQSAMP